MRLSVPYLRGPDQPSPAAEVYSTLSLPGLDLWVSNTCADADRPDWQTSNVSSWMRSDHYRYVMRVYLRREARLETICYLLSTLIGCAPMWLRPVWHIITVHSCSVPRIRTLSAAMILAQNTVAVRKLCENWKEAALPFGEYWRAWAYLGQCTALHITRRLPCVLFRQPHFRHSL